MLNKVKKALRITVNNYDAELTALISAAVELMQSLGINWAAVDSDDPMIIRAIITYCRANFGTPDDYDKMNAAFNSQIELLLISRHSHDLTAAPINIDPIPDDPDTPNDDPDTPNDDPDEPNTDDPNTPADDPNDNPGTDDPGIDTPITPPVPVYVEECYEPGDTIHLNVMTTNCIFVNDQGRSIYLNVPLRKKITDTITVTAGSMKFISFQGSSTTLRSIEATDLLHNYPDIDVTWDENNGLIFIMTAHQNQGIYFKDKLPAVAIGTIDLLIGEPEVNEEDLPDIDLTPLIRSANVNNNTIRPTMLGTAQEVNRHRTIEDIINDTLNDVHNDGDMLLNIQEDDSDEEI